MNFDSLIKKRRSVRNFSNKAADWKAVLHAIDASLQGPFAGNHNNIKFLIIEETKKIKEVAELCEQAWIADTSLLIVVCSDDTHLENLYGSRGRVYSRQQAGSAIQTIWFKLLEYGMDTCWVGAYSDEILKEKLKIPQHIQIEAILPVGYAKGKVPKKQKNNLEESLFWENWNATRRPSLFEESPEEQRPSS